MKHLYWFLWGMREFRLTFTLNAGDYQESYDWGREWAHRLTFRRYEPYGMD